MGTPSGLAPETQDTQAAAAEEPPPLPLSTNTGPFGDSSLGLRGVLLVSITLVAALAVDWLLVPWSYPVAAAYGVALLVAGHVLPSRAVVVVTFVAMALSITSNVLQSAPTAAWIADNTGLVVLGVLAWFLARQRQVARVARNVSEASRQRIELAFEAAQALSEATTLESAGAAMLASIGRHLDWTCGVLWHLDDGGDRLECIATWPRPDQPLADFEQDARARHIVRGSGLAGRVWASGQAVWLTDLQRETDLPHLMAASAEGLRSAFAFPLQHAGAVQGVIEFFDSGSRTRDRELLALMDTLGAQLGLFLGRRQAEAEVSALLQSERAARAEADESVRIRDDFLAAASHDLRGPLAAIRGYAGLTRRKVMSLDSDAALEYLGRIDAGVDRIAAALDELLDLAQLQAGRQLALDSGPTELVALVQRVAHDYEAAGGCSIRVVAQPSELTGAWDASRLERAFGNLVGNAIKYSPPGAEVELAVSMQLDARGVWAAVQVRDHGIGIPAADLPHVFERYHRAANAAGHLPGTGLGLWSALAIVQQTGGEISVESQEGYGSTFTVILPLADQGLRNTRA